MRTITRSKTIAQWAFVDTQPYRERIRAKNVARFQYDRSGRMEARRNSSMTQYDYRLSLIRKVNTIGNGHRVFIV